MPNMLDQIAVASGSQTPTRGFRSEKSSVCDGGYGEIVGAGYQVGEERPLQLRKHRIPGLECLHLNSGSEKTAYKLACIVGLSVSQNGR